MTAIAQHPSARFWTRLAPRYARQPIKDEAAYRRTLDRTRAWLSPGDRVIEVAGGTGSTALRLADAVAEYTVTDFSPGMVEIAAGKIADAGRGNLRAAVAAAESLPDREGPWDAILGFNFLHLAPDVPGTLAALRERLKPGGLLITKSACLGGRPDLRLMVGAMRLVGLAPPVTFFTIDGLETMIRDAGFRIEETGTFPAKPPARFVVARRI